MPRYEKFCRGGWDGAGVCALSAGEVVALRGELGDTAIDVCAGRGPVERAGAAGLPDGLGAGDGA